MGNEPGFFSPAALQLLAQINNHPLHSSERLDVDTINEIFSSSTGEDVVVAPSTKVKRKNSENTNLALPGCSVFSFGPPQDERRKRSRFEPKRRVEVRNVRKQGACFRCRVTKCPCSGTRPCETCTHDHIPTQHQASKHQWMSCVPFSLKEVDIYAIEFTCNKIEYQKILDDPKDVIGEDVGLFFDAPVPWELNALALDFADWMSNDRTDPLPPTSRVGILSSQRFKHLVDGFVDDGLCKNFRVFIELSSIIYNKGFKVPSVEDGSLDLWRLQYIAGSRFVRGLELALSAKSLARAPVEELKALFLLLVGAVLAVGYSKPWTGTIEQHGSTQISVQNFEATRHQLIRILAHHVIVIAERLSILHQNASKKSLVEGADNRWNKKAIFEWSPICASDSDGSFSLDNRTFKSSSLEFAIPRNPDVSSYFVAETSRLPSYAETVNFEEVTFEDYRDMFKYCCNVGHEGGQELRRHLYQPKGRLFHCKPSSDVVPICTDLKSKSSVTWSDWLTDDPFEDEEDEKFLGSLTSVQSHRRPPASHSCQALPFGPEVDLNLLV